MASLPSLKTITYDEWLRMPEVQDAIEEVVNGEIRIMPAPKIDHAIIARLLCKAFDAQLSPEMYLVLDNAFGLIVRKNPLTSRVPDLAVFELSTMIQENGYVHSPPQLLAE